MELRKLDRQRETSAGTLSDDEETRWRARAREKALHDEASFLASARREGLAEGLEQGRGEGMQKALHQGEATALLRLLVKRFGPVPTEVEERIHRAPLKQIEAWLDRLIDAPSLNAVFSEDDQRPLTTHPIAHGVGSRAWHTPVEPTPWANESGTYRLIAQGLGSLKSTTLK